jgi:putative MATE family efflux protein
MGGGIASAIARALGARRRDDANLLVLHAMALGVGFGLAFMVALLLGGRWLYMQMGGEGASLDAALAYSNWVFAGAVLVWLANCLAAAVRGTGNMAVPAIVNVAGLAVLIPLSPLLIFGWGPVPAMGIRGGALALLIYYAGSAAAMAWYLWSPRSLLRPPFAGATFKKPLFMDILRVGVVGAISTIATNLAIGITTAFAGSFGPEAIAGYGTAARLEYLLVPMVFGMGGPLVAMVGTCIGAGQRERAMRATWTGAVIAVVMSETVGVLAALFPRAWLELFTHDEAAIRAGTLYLHAVGPAYGFFGLGLVLYFASQGAGKLRWPVIGNFVRLAAAAIGGWLALHLGGSLMLVFVAQGVALVLYGLVNAGSIWAGAWFGPLAWPVRRVMTPV